MKRHHWELDVKAEVLEKGYGFYGGGSAFSLSFLVPGEKGGYRRMKGSGPNPDQEVPGHLT